MNIKNKLLLIPKDFIPTFENWIVEGVFNPGVIRLSDKRIILYVRVAESVVDGKGLQRTCPVIISDKNYKVYYSHVSKKKILDRGKQVTFLKGSICRLNTISHFRRVWLREDGFQVEKIEEIPAFVGTPGCGDFGVEDPRIVKINGSYIMTYVSVSLHEGVCTSLAISKDLKNWDKKGIIFRQQNKDVVIFPEKINNEYVALHRPEGTMNFSKKSIWISHSRDLIYWGKEKSILRARSGSWGSDWVGSGPPPFKTKKGWLLIYHGVRTIKNKNIYSVGAALLDLKNPLKVIARTPINRPLIKPKEEYEKNGFINDVIFPTGLVEDLDKKHILLYSGGADRITTVKKLNLNEILDSLQEVT